jgi:formylglycine-generating enzyme required for sulfatase activity
MAGNVWEWCGPLENVRREVHAVVRGGSWLGVAEFAHSAYRIDYLPDFRAGYVGFRVVGAGGVRTL